MSKHPPHNTMTYTPQLSQADLAEMIDREGLEFEVRQPGDPTWAAAYPNKARHWLDQEWIIRVAPGELNEWGLPGNTPPHNPDNLTPEQITEGGKYRAVTCKEIGSDALIGCEAWWPGDGWFVASGKSDHFTYRVPVNTPFPKPPVKESLTPEPSDKTAVERLADILEMPADHIREAAQAMRQERTTNALLEKVRLIRDGNTAIMQNGEIVPRGTPGSMDYETSTPEPPAPVESETPRTDAVKPTGAFHEFRAEDYADLARQLETELRAAQRKLDEAHGLLERAKPHIQQALESSVRRNEYEEADNARSTLTAINQHLAL